MFGTKIGMTLAGQWALNLVDPNSAESNLVHCSIHLPLNFVDHEHRTNSTSFHGHTHRCRSREIIWAQQAIGMCLSDIDLIATVYVIFRLYLEFFLTAHYTAR